MGVKVGARVAGVVVVETVVDCSSLGVRKSIRLKPNYCLGSIQDNVQKH